METGGFDCKEKGLNKAPFLALLFRIYHVWTFILRCLMLFSQTFWMPFLSIYVGVSFETPFANYTHILNKLLLK